MSITKITGWLKGWYQQGCEVRIPRLIETYGLPQEWNASGKLGPDRYIEAQVWADEPLLAYLPVHPK